MIENPLILNKSTITSKVLDNTEIVNLLDKTFLIPNEFTYNVIEVPKDCIARMDLIANQIYGDPSFSDLLCKLNGISNPFELNGGDMIVCPNVSDICNFYYIESPYEKEIEDDKKVNKPIPKGVKEKRKPNEAVIGDKRYKVDRANKVIIY
jgi:hypothetical protein